MNAHSSAFAAHASPLPDLGTVLDRSSFFAVIEAAIRVAEQGSAPVLMLVELAWRAASTDCFGEAATARLVSTAPLRIADALGGNGFICALGETRLAVLAASDSSTPATTLGAAMIASLARPAQPEASFVTPDPVLAMAVWGVDGETPEELFVAADLALHAKLRGQTGDGASIWRSSPVLGRSDVSQSVDGIRLRRSPLWP
jgi:predicted signal transduction protein with EAL and GGDEF domain